MIYLLDTNTCIRHLNGTSESVRHRMAAARPQDLVLCSVVKAELFLGALKSARPKQNLKKLEGFMSAFASLPFDDRAARFYGRIRARLEKVGKAIGPNDFLRAPPLEVVGRHSGLAKPSTVGPWPVMVVSSAYS